MSTSDESSGSGRSGSRPNPTSRIFINYRHEDTDGQALALYGQLKDHFGAESIFLDVKNLKPGMKWLEEIKAGIRSHDASLGVLLVLIGRHWMSSLTERAQARYANPVEDYVILEIEFALRMRSGIEVIPVLVGEGAAPSADRLPKSIKALAAFQVAQLRHHAFDADVETLIGRIEQVARTSETVRQEEIARKEETAPQNTNTGLDESVDGDSRPVAPRPDAGHLAKLFRYMVVEGTVVPLLGSRVNTSAHQEAWQEGCGRLPDAEELAADLARRFELQREREPLDLAEVAELVYVTSGESDLYRSLKQILVVDCEPGSVHRFLAGLPTQLEMLDLPKRYQMIVSTNYDTALEQAFDEANEPYDLAVYMASGEDKGKFVHHPFDADSEPVHVPNEYGKFPFEDSLELQRTLIVKIHGAVDGYSSNYRWKENYVITEDHYIDYMSESPVGSLIPIQILSKLRESHCLFLGYTMRDWRVRVFLKRIWKGGRLSGTSWAVEPQPDIIEKDFWRSYGVELFAAPLAEYVYELHEYLAAHAEDAYRR